MTLMSMWDNLPQEIQRVILEFREHMKIIEHFTVHVKVELLNVTRTLRDSIEDKMYEGGRYQRVYCKNAHEMWTTRLLYVPLWASMRTQPYLHMCRLFADGRGIVWKYVHSF